MIGTRRALLLVAVVAVAFAPLLWSPLVFDDGHAVADNQAIRTLRNLPAFFVDPSLFSSTGQRMWRPLVMVSLTIDHWLSGGAAAWFKAGDLLLHCGVALGLYWFVATRVGGCAAALAAVVFALHPLQTEAVALVSARSELLLGLGTVIALCAWWPRPGQPPRDLLGLLGMAVALLAKESAIALLLVVLAVRAVQARPAGIQGPATEYRTRLLLPFVLLLVWLLLRKLVLGHATGHVPALASGGDPRSGGTRDLVTQLLIQAQFLPRAVSMFFVPLGQSLDHALPELLRWKDLRVAGGVCLVLGTVGFVLMQRRRRPLVFVGGLAAAGFAAPWVLMPLNVPFAEHRLYLPLLGVSLAIAGLLHKVPLRRWHVGAVALLLGGFTFARCLQWRSEETLWRNVLAGNPRSFRALTSLGHAWWQNGDVSRARQSFDEAVLVYPRYRAAVEGLTATLLLEGEQQQSIELIDRGLQLADRSVTLRPADPMTHLSAAEGWLMRARLSGKAEDFARCEALARRCLELAEPKATVYCYLAEARAGQGDAAGAERLLAEAGARNLPRAPLQFTRARLWAAAGRLREAELLFQELLLPDPFDPRVRRELAALYRRMGRPEAARAYEAMAPGAAPNK
jgi:tetratricopeptide (TPR) repeat protein